MQETPRFTHQVTVKATLDLDEQQLGALDALAGYGTDAFLETFYVKMGRAYLQPYEKGLRSLFDTIKATCPKALQDVRKAREALFEQEQARQRKRLTPPVNSPTEGPGHE